MRTPALLPCLGAALLAAAAEGPGQPSAFALLDQVRAAYSRLASYQDRGEVERTITSPDGVARVARFRFETAADAAGGFRLTLEAGEGPAEQRRVVWRDAAGTRVYDRARDQVRRVDSPVAELVRSLGEGSLEALLVPALLAGEGEALAPPEAASLEGSEPCGDGECWVVATTRMGGAVESRLWIDQRSLLLHQVEVRLLPPEEIMARALAEAGLAPRPGPPARAASTSSFRVRHRVAGPDQPLPATALAFEPPATARAAADPPEAAVPPDLTFHDRVDVALATLRVRVVDADNQPFLDLRPEDFRVRVDGHEVAVQALDWVSSDQPYGSDIPPQILAESGLTVAPPGKLVLFFVQADLHALRIKGHLASLPQAREVLGSLHPEDRAAVVSFDSHLKLRQDFTRDRERLAAALFDAIKFGPGSEIAAGPYPSLGRHLDPRQARRAASPERGLELVATAFARLTGEKVVVYLGWGLGSRRFRGGLMPADVVMPLEYDRAREVLNRAGIPVFVLDVSYADSHTLELGLQQVAAETGGDYFRAHTFRHQATRDLIGALAGYYLLSFELAEPDRPRRRVRIDLKDKQGTVQPSEVTLR